MGQMGNKPSIKMNDTVNSLDTTERLHYLVHGYFTKNEFKLDHIPIEIVMICIKYIETIYIESRTEHESYKNLLKQCKNAHQFFRPAKDGDRNKVKLCVVGQHGVGKSHLVIRYIFGHLSDEYDQEYYRKLVEVDNIPFYLEILDTDGSENALGWDWFYREAQLFVYTYDITNRESFNKIEYFIQRIKDEKCNDAKLFGIVAGTHCDLESQRKVSKIEPMNLVQKYDNFLFMETSSKENINVKELFDQCVRLWMQSCVSCHSQKNRQCHCLFC